MLKFTFGFLALALTVLTGFMFECPVEKTEEDNVKMSAEEIEIEVKDGKETGEGVTLVSFGLSEEKEEITKPV